WAAMVPLGVVDSCPVAGDVSTSAGPLAWALAVPFAVAVPGLVAAGAVMSVAVPLLAVCAKAGAATNSDAATRVRDKLRIWGSLWVSGCLIRQRSRRGVVAEPSCL